MSGLVLKALSLGNPTVRSKHVESLWLRLCSGSGVGPTVCLEEGKFVSEALNPVNPATPNRYSDWENLHGLFRGSNPEWNYIDKEA